MSTRLKWLHALREFEGPEASLRDCLDVRNSSPLYSSDSTQKITGELTVLIKMELARIIISELNDHQMVFLNEVDGKRNFPIVIGLFEATSIDRRVQGQIAPRPLTHDLLKNVIEEMGGEAKDIVINNLVEHTYYSVIRIELNGEIVEVDSRPSDAISLSVHYDPPLPIYVDEEVLLAAIQSE